MGLWLEKTPENIVKETNQLTFFFKKITPGCPCCVRMMANLKLKILLQTCALFCSMPDLIFLFEEKQVWKGTIHRKEIMPSPNSAEWILRTSDLPRAGSRFPKFACYLQQQSQPRAFKANRAWLKEKWSTTASLKNRMEDCPKILRNCYV